MEKDRARESDTEEWARPSVLRNTTQGGRGEIYFHFFPPARKIWVNCEIITNPHVSNDQMKILINVLDLVANRWCF